MNLREYLSLVRDAYALLQSFSLHTTDTGLQQLIAFDLYMRQQDSPWLHYHRGVKPNQDNEQSLYQRYAHLFSVSYPTLLYQAVHHDLFELEWHQLSSSDIAMLFAFNPDIYCVTRTQLDSSAFSCLLDVPALMQTISLFPLLEGFVYAQRAGELFQLRKKSQLTPYASFFEDSIRQQPMSWDILSRTRYAATYIQQERLAHNVDWIEFFNVDLEQDYSDNPSSMLQQLIKQERAYYEQRDIQDSCMLISSFSTS